METLQGGMLELRSQGLLLPIADLERADDLPRALFVREVLDHPHPVVAGARAERDGEPLALAQLARRGQVERASLNDRGVSQALLRLADGSPLLVDSEHHSRAYRIWVAGSDANETVRAAESVAAAIRIERKVRDSSVPVAFWSGSNDAFVSSGEPRWRRLTLPSFHEIADNYPAAVRKPLGELFGQVSGHALPGRLALWHGLPGTGKTWALRALGREWSKWCDLHYVTDPERLLGGDTAYMMSVLLGDQGSGRAEALGAECEDEDDCEAKERWRLLVLEDAGELLGIAAPTDVGRAFARLLNVIDGLLGQGTRALVLVTTNEPLGKLHPAALRPGRAMMKLEFIPLEVAEGQEWLRRRGVARELASPATIAELHALLSGVTSAPEPRAPVGFAQPNEPVPAP